MSNPTRVPSQSSAARVISSSKRSGAAHAETRARQSYSGPNHSSYSAPTVGVPAERLVHHWSSPAGVLTTRNTSAGGTLMGKSL
jgi:hypothetical protein